MSEEKKAKKNSEKIAVILIRGLVGVNKKIKDTIYLLKLRKKHTCVIINNTDSNIGMIKKIKDYVTYGYVSAKILKELVSKKGRKDSNGKLKPFFELPPPIGGFEKKGIKKSFKQGGALGNRGLEINILIKKMLR
ncbi:50S ribosomal protein L30 [Candidatus Woesearchaeota archaeon]|jgi:large subunit ribosomal protein L30|nr:50S ribosomal protein L30 [Candidatus Woesearchaeota archaeon]|tara:strand:+ start:438 stop:842 length:405 start_codon:yes stop_codon:yes gene_type:complete